MKNRIIFKIPQRMMSHDPKHRLSVRSAITKAFGVPGEELNRQPQIFTCLLEQWFIFYKEISAMYDNIPSWLCRIQDYSDSDNGVYFVFPPYEKRYPPRNGEILIALTIPKRILEDRDKYDAITDLLECTPQDDEDIVVVCDHEQYKQLKTALRDINISKGKNGDDFDAKPGGIRQEVHMAKDFIKEHSHVLQIYGTQHYVVGRTFGHADV